MNVPTEVFQVAFVLAVTVIPVIVMIRLVAGHEDFGFDALVRHDATLPWPKGVQEEEPQPWKVGSALREPGATHGTWRAGWDSNPRPRD